MGPARGWGLERWLGRSLCGWDHPHWRLQVALARQWVEGRDQCEGAGEWLLSGQEELSLGRPNLKGHCVGQQILQGHPHPGP